MNLQTKLDEMRKRCEAADRLVCDLASGKKKWNMCIPAQEDDTDFVLTNPLRDMPLLISALEVCMGALNEAAASSPEIEKTSLEVLNDTNECSEAWEITARRRRKVAQEALAKAEALLVGEGEKNVR